MLTPKQIIDAIRAKPRIPAPSQTVCRILSLSRSADCDLSKVASLAATDAGLTAQLLREANSALLGARAVTSSVLQSCTRLGLKRIRSAVINQHVMSGLGKSCPPGFDAQRHFQSALAVSVAAQGLCAEILKDRAEDAATAGLLCDLGIGLMAYGIPAEYRLVLAEWTRDNSADLHRIEQKQLHLTHAEVGAAVLSDWGLDKSIIEAVEHHHRAVAEAEKLELPVFAKAVAAAVCLAGIALSGSDMDRVSELFERLEKLTPNPDKLVSQLLDDLVAKIQEAASTFAIELGSTENLEANLAGLLKDLENAVQRA